jgi:hypothetical protein
LGGFELILSKAFISEVLHRLQENWYHLGVLHIPSPSAIFSHYSNGISPKGSLKTLLKILQCILRVSAEQKSSNISLQASDCVKEMSSPSSFQTLGV